MESWNQRNQNIANLTCREDLLMDIKLLEARMKQELHQDIALIAYSLPNPNNQLDGQEAQG
ncbi:hypothetical protein [Paenibacillus hexagrammi]|uniref:Uncharacterized protein n=1 Tax=Paenibacillus hexagrammi TaxID=2908839 RepID=A0ABY3SPR3_9BACL|nr:hypothetical protein [Paenibacillus sp. YPD9-1]UJF35936.1 hypothetical protein L0M14_13140 [Paenibacillus sp. YPD9-1]